MLRKILLAACMMGLLGGCAANQSTDTQGPYINLTTYEFHTYTGEPIDFSNISAYDDVDGMLPVYVINDANYQKPGEYYPVLTSRDTTGNVTEVPVTVIVEENSFIEADEEGIIPEEEEKEESCTVISQSGETVPCGDVDPERLDSYLMLFSGHGAMERCLAKAREIHGSCEVIVSYDQTVWGAGLSEKGEEEPEDHE